MPIMNTTISGGGSGPAGLYRELEISSGTLVPNTTTSHIIDFTNVTDVANYVLAYAYANNNSISGFVDMSDLVYVTGSMGCMGTFSNCQLITGIDLSSLQQVSLNSCEYMFLGDTGLLSVDLSSLETVAASGGVREMFKGCTSLPSISLHSLKSVAGPSGALEMFMDCTALTNANLESLTELSDNYCCSGIFGNCSLLSNINLSSLTILSGSSVLGQAFSGCSALTNLSFPSITPTSFGSRTNQFVNMCENIPNITLHFPSNVQSQVEALNGYSTTAPFGAVAGTVLFDLPATDTLTGADSKTYSRNPKYDTATALAWKVGAYGTTDFTPFYTSGTSNPSVSDTIYSDDACTIAETTISTIA